MQSTAKRKEFFQKGGGESVGEGARRESLASPTSTGRGSVGEEPQPRGVDVGQRNS